MNTIQNILLELYSIDPGLREHEEQLKQVIEKIIAQKPQVKIDDVFVKNLRKKILGTELKKPFTFSLLFMNNKLLWAGTAALVAILAIGVPLYLTNPKPFNNSLALRGSESGITSLKNSAFGSLIGSGTSAPLGSPEVMSSLQAGGRGAGGGGGITANAAVSNPPIADMKMIAPAFSYTFKYTGAPFTLDETALPVYNRVKSSALSQQLANSLAGTNNGFFDLSLFKNTKVQNITLVEDRDDGYSISLEVQENRASIGPAYDRWYKPNCTPDGNCQYPAPVTEKDVPSNDKLIQIANSFLSAYNIDRSSYGEPQVDDQWKNSILPASLRGTEPVYVPDLISIIYPLIIEGQEISEANGYGFGLRVQVDIRKMKSQGVYNIIAQNYQKSNYEVENNVDRILKVAQSGWGNYYNAPEKRELQLGAPERVYIPHYQFSYETQTSNELFVPALRFPILNVPADQPYFNKFVVVPLPKEILDQLEKQSNGVMPLDPAPIQIMRDTGAGVSNQSEGSTAYEVSPEVKKVFEEYVKNNISTLSPNKEVLGGKFYITKVEHQPGATAVVSYEDGHVAYTARVKYEVNEPGKVEIKSFEILPEKQ